ncbi:DUF6069 family protein [Kribbella sp. NPDC049584]|uniref:DUF6069 family protein n=1 Tax=Kribbella sp. NPDC049584 TaxID=3154833 RepID=UPI003419ADE3
MTSIDVRQPATGDRAGRRWLMLLPVAAVVAVGLNYLVARGATALGADESFRPLTPAVFVPFTLIGIAAGFAGWRAVVRRVARPHAVLRVLVPVVLVLSMIPDLLLLATGFIPHTSGIAVAGLMLMHVVVTAVAVPAYALSRG